MSTVAVMEHHDFPVEAPAPEQSNHDYSLQESKDETPSIWRSLLQLRLLLPYIGKLLPMLDTNLSTALTPAVAPRLDLTEVNRSVADVTRGFQDLQAGHREIKSYVQDHTIQLKRIDDQLIRLRESTERNTMEHQELVEDLRSASKLVRTLSTVMIVLMVAVAAMTVFMLTRVH